MGIPAQSGVAINYAFIVAIADRISGHLLRSSHHTHGLLSNLKNVGYRAKTAVAS